MNKLVVYTFEDCPIRQELVQSLYDAICLSVNGLDSDEIKKTNLHLLKQPPNLPTLSGNIYGKSIYVEVSFSNSRTNGFENLEVKLLGNDEGILGDIKNKVREVVEKMMLEEKEYGKKI